MPDRDERFSYMLGLISAGGTSALRVLDLACGPGSLTTRVRAAYPDAVVVAVDLDPVLLAIYRGLHPEVTVVDIDLRDPSWVSSLPTREFDVAMTATALHWLAPTAVERVYRDLAALLVDGGLFVNADHVPLADSVVLVDRCDRILNLERANLPSQRHDWPTWWAAVSADPVLGPLVDERRRRFADRGDDFTPSEEWHLTALANAGFTERSIVWRRGSDAVLAALR